MTELVNRYLMEENLLQEGYSYIAGFDEAGRGPLAGPVVAACVVLNPKKRIEGLNDSKQLSEKKRLTLAKIIKEKALAYHISFVDEITIDQMNIYQASKLAMVKAYQGISLPIDYLLTDAMPLESIALPQQAIIHGDCLSASIAAASILAKTARDAFMKEIAKQYPQYGFEQHKGYPTKLHLQKLQEFGVSPIHRKSYKPVQDCLHQDFNLFT